MARPFLVPAKLVVHFSVKENKEKHSWINKTRANTKLTSSNSFEISPNLSIQDHLLLKRNRLSDEEEKICFSKLLESDTISRCFVFWNVIVP